MALAMEQHVVAYPVGIGFRCARTVVSALAGKPNLLKQAGWLRRNNGGRTP